MATQEEEDRDEQHERLEKPGGGLEDQRGHVEPPPRGRRFRSANTPKAAVAPARDLSQGVEGAEVGEDDVDDVAPVRLRHAHVAVVPRNRLRDGDLRREQHQGRHQGAKPDGDHHVPCPSSRGGESREPRQMVEGQHQENDGERLDHELGDPQVGCAEEDEISATPSPTTPREMMDASRALARTADSAATRISPASSPS